MNIKSGIYFRKLFTLRSILMLFVLVAFLFGYNGATYIFRGLPSAKADSLNSFAGVVGKSQNKSFLQEELSKKIDKVHVPFIANEGQIANPEIKFRANIFSGGFYVSNDEITYSLIKKNEENLIKESFDAKSRKRNFSIYRFSEQFIDKNGNSINYKPQGVEKSGTALSIIKGKDKSKWKSDLDSFNAVDLGAIWPGIQVGLRAYGKNVEKIFSVNPGVDPNDIALKISGAKELQISESGELVVDTAGGKVSMTKPVAYQYDRNGNRKNVSVSYKIKRDNEYGFKLGNYDHSRQLIIDPLLAATLIGSSYEGAYSDVFGVAAGSDGRIIITGFIDDIDFPTTAGAWSTDYLGSTDVFISSFNSDLSALEASTYFGGSDGGETGRSVVVDDDGNIYVCGWTESTDFPGWEIKYQDVLSNAFVAKFDSELSTLAGSMILDGTDGSGSQGYGLALGPEGSVYVVGSTTTIDFPIVGSDPYMSTKPGGGLAVFIARVNSSVTSITASTYFGGDNEQEGYNIVIDSASNVIISGLTDTYDGSFPTTVDAYHDFNVPDYATNSFVSKFDADLENLLGSTFLDSTVESMEIAVDGSGRIYTASWPTDIPGFGDPVYYVPENAYDTSYDKTGYSSYIAILNSGMTDILYATYFDRSSIKAIQVDSSDNVYIAGTTWDTELPTFSTAFQRAINGSRDSYAVEFNNTLRLVTFGTYYGGDGDDESANAMVLDSSNNIIIAGSTSTLIPTTASAFQREITSSQDGFVAKFSTTGSGGGESPKSPGSTGYIPTLPPLTMVFDYLNTNVAEMSSGVEHELYFVTQDSFSGSANTITLIFPDSDSGLWCRNSGSDLDITTTGLREESATSLPGTLSGYCTAGSGSDADLIVINGVGSLTAGVLYGVIFSGASDVVLGSGSADKKIVDVRIGDGADDINEAQFEVDLSIDPEVNISGYIPPTLSFVISNNLIGFGTILPSEVRFATADGTGSDVEPTNGEPVKLTFSTNANDGAVIHIRSLYAGFYSAGSDHTIPAVASSSVAAGSEGYGVYGKNASGITIDPGFDNNGSGDSAVTASDTQLVYSSAPIDNSTVDLALKIGVDSTTSAGTYIDVLTLTATGRY